MVAFDHLILLSLLILIPVCIVLFLLMLRWKKNTMQKFGDTGVVQRILTDHSTFRPVVKFVLLMLALAMLVFAVINMKIGSKMSSVKRKGLDIIIALDISNSMRWLRISSPAVSCGRKWLSQNLLINLKTTRSE